MISREEFAAWLEYPVTKEFFANIQAAMDKAILSVLNGETLGDTKSATQSRTEIMVGYAQGLSELTNWLPEFTPER